MILWLKLVIVVFSVSTNSCDTITVTCQIVLCASSNIVFTNLISILQLPPILDSELIQHYIFILHYF